MVTTFFVSERPRDATGALHTAHCRPPSEDELGAGGLGLVELETVETDAWRELPVEEAGEVEEQVLRGGLELDKNQLGGIATEAGVGAGVRPNILFGKDEGVVEAVDYVLLNAFLEGMEVQYHPVGGCANLGERRTLDGDEEAVAQGVDAAHDENTSILSYNNENSLACVLSIAYYYAKNDYIMYRELPTGRGFADIVLIPRKNAASPAIVLELK